MKKEMLEINEVETSIEISGNKISSILKKDITKKGARVFKDSKIYSASCVGEIVDNEIIKNAIENIDGAISYDYDLPSRKSLEVTNFLVGKNVTNLKHEYESALELLRTRFPNFIFSGKAGLKRVSKRLSFDSGGKQSLSYDVCEWYLIYKHRNSAGIIDGVMGSDSVAEVNILSSIENYSKYLEVYENEVTLKAGMMPVVFVTANALYSKVLESARVDLYKKEVGLFKNRLGEKILSDRFSLYDVSYAPELGAMNAFDAEGFVRENSSLPLVENGVLKTLIADSRNAKKYSTPNTGNAQRVFDSNVNLGFNTIVAGAGERTVAQIMNDLPECIVVEMAAGGDFTDLGDYSTPVQNGFLVKKGKVIGKVPQITLTSSVAKMFGDDLLEISSDSLSDLAKGPAIFMNMNVMLN